MCEGEGERGSVGLTFGLQFGKGVKVPLFDKGTPEIYLVGGLVCREPCYGLFTHAQLAMGIAWQPLTGSMKHLPGPLVVALPQFADVFWGKLTWQRIRG